MSDNHARYFFNAGGQLAISISHPSGLPMDRMLHTLAASVGTIVISSPNSGSVDIAGKPYNGITGVGTTGSGNNTDTVHWENYGYYGLTTDDTEIWRQTSFAGYSGYLGTYIAVLVSTSPATGANGDNGNIINITVKMEEVPHGILVSGGTRVTLTVRPPGTGYLPTTSWGTVNVVGSCQSTY